jgi:hypothetical protein
MLALGLGLIAPVAAFGVIAERSLPMTILGDAAMTLFFLKVGRRYPPDNETRLEPESERTNRNVSNVGA